MTRRRLTAEARRTELLDACAAVVDTEGFHAVTIDRVATACGVTRAVVYQQLGGLDGMLEALVARATARAAAAVARAAADTEHPTPRAVMTHVLAAADEDPATWRMFLTAPRSGPPALTAALARGRALIRAHTRADIERRSGGAAADPELTARMLQALADELVRLHLEDPATYPTERILAQLDAVGHVLLTPLPTAP